MTYLEHANITVPDVDAAAAFLKTVSPDFSIRHDGVGADGIRWMHVGDDSHYFALRNPGPKNRGEQVSRDLYHVGVNHLGVVVQDVQAVSDRLNAAGYSALSAGDSHPYRRRVYFLDHAGFEWEFIEYLTQDVAKRNTYD